MKYVIVLLSLLLFAPAFAADKESAYDRVMRTGTIRCGYIPYSFAFKVDPATKEKSGVNYEIVNKIGRLMNLKIDWIEELTWATVTTAIETGRVDAMCSGMWIDTQNGKFMAFTQPLYFNSISAYGRADERRFRKLSDLNVPEARIVSGDGQTPGIIAGQDFPKATIVGLAASVSSGEMIEQILTRKADIIFYGDDYMLDYMAKNPGRLKSLLPNDKLRVYGTAIALPIKDAALKNMFDNAITELKGSKFIDRTLAKYVPAGGWLNSIK